MIPRKIHHIWVGPDPLPKSLEPYVNSWKKQHPSWEHHFWTEDNLPEDPVRPEVLNRLRSPVERSDILRLEILYRHGGAYVDTDLECLRPIDDLLAGSSFVGTCFKPDRVTNTFMASEPNHPMLERALAELKPREVYGFDKEVAGPPFLAKLVPDYPEIVLLEPRYIFPRDEEERANAVAIHHMTRTWKDADGLRKSMQRAEERLEKMRVKLAEERRAHAQTKKKLAKAEGKREKADKKKSPKEKKGEPGTKKEKPDERPERLRARLLRRGG
jgi:inositol phosphorylceramide mannosyltransferase catalytic subunit